MKLAFSFKVFCLYSMIQKSHITMANVYFSILLILQAFWHKIWSTEIKVQSGSWEWKINFINLLININEIKLAS